MRNSAEALQRLEGNGLTVKKKECVLLAEFVEYLGFFVNKEGRFVSSDKTGAVIDMLHHRKSVT